MSQFTIPEILRTPLLSLCLQTKLLALPNTPIANFLARVPNPPPLLITRNAVQSLKSMEALDPWEDVTPLGSHLLDIPLDPWLGKILLHEVILKCLDPILMINCTLAYRNPFMLPVDQAGKKTADMARKRLAAETGSDHMAMLRAFQEWQLARMEGRKRRWCKANMVSSSTMEMVVGMRNQVLAQLGAGEGLHGGRVVPQLGEGGQGGISKRENASEIKEEDSAKKDEVKDLTK
jgi:HrpA-like RNA helicase